ncbi:MAG: YrhK family protein [Streptosporangiales bacterium]|nr:YrhK family protein [Streptosporangiales bacterium]
MRILDPTLHTLSPRHLEVFWRYQLVRTGVDFGAACCFVVGSICFFYASLDIPAAWLFLIGSILFAVKPSIDMVRSLHLRRLPASEAAEEITEEAESEVVSG